MSDYISREEAKMAVVKAISNQHSPFNAIVMLPAADVRSVVRGKWREDWETGCSDCSACGESYLWEDYDGVGEWNFCPNCGAWMEES